MLKEEVTSLLTEEAGDARQRAVISLLKEKEVTAWPMEEAIGVRQRAMRRVPKEEAAGEV